MSFWASDMPGINWKGVRIEEPKPVVERVYIDPVESATKAKRFFEEHGQLDAMTAIMLTGFQTRMIELDIKQFMAHRFTGKPKEYEEMHAHPWPLAVKVLDGAYRMRTGKLQPDGSVRAGETFEVVPGTVYSMTSPRDLHSLEMLTETSKSIAYRGSPFPETFGNIPDVSSSKRLTDAEISDVLNDVLR